MTLTDLVAEFNTTPFLFIGAGLSRRYLGLPDWKGLLEHFSRKVKDDDFSYAAYENRAKTMECSYGLMPKIAELIQNDYDALWFDNPEIRNASAENLEKIKNGTSPFKAEIADYIRSFNEDKDSYNDEITALSNISKKNIAGVITTNYDSFIENHFNGYVSYVGQNELIFSSIQGIAEIYKIHGSIANPDSIVINENDYREFDEKSKYLAAKLMTIFMEYPIIFMGYSISDPNVQSIINSIAGILNSDQLKKLEDRFIFVEYVPDKIGVEVSSYTIMIKDKPLMMKKVTLSDYLILYKALEGKKSKLPVKILRRFKEELYTYTITSTPTSNLRLAGIDDERIDDEELVIALGKPGKLGIRGLNGITGNEWYTDIVMDTLDFTADEKLSEAYPRLLSQNSNKLPVFKHLKQAGKQFPNIESELKITCYEDLISNTNKKQRKSLKNETIKTIWESNDDVKRKLRLIGCLEEKQVDVDYLENILVTAFSKDIKFLDNIDTTQRSNYKLLIRIYDYLKWAK